MDIHDFAWFSMSALCESTEEHRDVEIAAGAELSLGSPCWFFFLLASGFFVRHSFFQLANLVRRVLAWLTSCVGSAGTVVGVSYLHEQGRATSARG